MCCPFTVTWQSQILMLWCSLVILMCSFRCFLWDRRIDLKLSLVSEILYKSVSDFEQVKPFERPLWEPPVTLVTVMGGSDESFLSAEFFLKCLGWVENWLRESKEQKMLLFPASFRQERRRLEFTFALWFSFITDKTRFGDCRGNFSSSFSHDLSSLSYIGSGLELRL